MQNMIEFYHDNGLDMLEFGCTLPNLANICLHKSTDYKIYPFLSGDSDLLEKIRKDMTRGPSFVFTRKAFANETLIRKSNNLNASTVEIDIVNSNLIPRIRMYPQARIRDGTTVQNYKDSRQGKIKFASLKKWSCQIFKLLDLNVKLGLLNWRNIEKKLIA